MNRVLRKTLPIFLAILVNLLTLGIHSTAMAASSHHSSGGMSHQSTAGLNCISLCTASTPAKLRLVNDQDEKDDDHTPTFYAAKQTIAQAFDEKHTNQTRVAIALEPPPGPPIYVLNSTLRF